MKPVINIVGLGGIHPRRVIIDGKTTVVYARALIKIVKLCIPGKSARYGRSARQRE